MTFSKNKILKIIVSLSFLTNLSAFAAPDPVATTTRRPNEPTSQRDFTADEISQIKEMLFDRPLKPYSVNIYGLLQANVNFVDTTRDNVPDFRVSHARLGVFAIEKNWSGKLEVEFNGNQPRMEFPDLDPKPIFLAQSANNTAGVRQAQINFDFFRFVVKNGHDDIKAVKASVDAKSDEPAVVLEQSAESNKVPNVQSRTKKTISQNTQTTNEDQPKSASALTDTIKTDTSFVSRLSLGGVRVGGALAVAPDVAYTPSGFARQDGIFLIENAAFGEQIVGSFGVGVFNNLNTTTVGASGIYQGWGAYPGTSPNFLGILGVTSPTRSKAFVFNTIWSYNFDKNTYLNAILYYGFQNNAAVNTNGNGFATTTRDAQHIEASLLFNNTKMFGSEALVSGNGLAVWFEGELGSNQTITPAGVNLFLNDLNDGYASYLYGIGFGGDTHNHFPDLLFDADRLLYAISATYVQAKFKDPSFSKNYNVTQLAAQIGYGYRTLEFNLVGAYAFSNSTAFANFKVDDPITSRNATRPNQVNLYLTASLYF